MNTKFLLGATMVAFGVTAIPQTADATGTQTQQLRPMNPKNLKFKQVKPVPNLKYHAACKVLHNGDVDFGLYFINDGVLSIAAGSEVHWVIKSDNRAGNYTFNKSLPRGKAVEALAHPAHVTIGAPCTATFLN